NYLHFQPIKNYTKLLTITFEYARNHNFIYKNRNKLKGLENVIYVCPKCKKEYSLETTKSVCKCNCCGFELKVKDNYSFENNELNIVDLPDLYKRQVEYEKEMLEKSDLNISCKVNVMNIILKIKN
ncbi:MAG: hypothetical protein ACI311_04930, partial [Bacilli bacterium]